MYDVIVREKKILAIVGTLDAIAGIIFLMLSVGNGLQKQEVSLVFFCGFIFAAMLALGLGMLLSYFLRRLCLGYTNCYYRTMFGRKKEFRLRDIKKVEQKIRFGEITIILWGSDGKQLAQVEMNMENAEKILPFLKEYQLPAIESDPVWQNKKAWENMKERYEKYKDSRYYPERQRNHRKAAEEEWKENPAFYQRPGQVRHIRIQARILDLLGVVVAVVLWNSARQTAAIWFVGYPLVIFAFYFAFPRVLIWDRNTGNTEKEKEEYVQMPFLGPGFTLGCGILRMTGINIDDTWKAVVFGAALLTALMGLLLLLFKKKRIVELGIPICILCLYCYTGVYYWNCAFSVGEAEHIRAEVVEKRDSGEGSSSHYYYLMLRTGDREDKKAEVVYSLYKRTGKGDTMFICRHVSVFGIHYYHVHL